MPNTLQSLTQQGVRLIDVRAPGEFNKGAPPGAINLPILTDAERHKVGLTYKHQGQQAAIKLGNRLVSGNVKSQRVAGWCALIEQHPATQLYCWRGGLRSQTAAQWLHEAGYPTQTVSGGFKALRTQSLQTLETAAAQLPWTVLGGRTGSGKTTLLHNVDWAIDLEGAAKHRGSAFGNTPEPQPCPVSFDFRLSTQLAHHSASRILVEDESRTIGRLALPNSWYDAMQRAPIVLLEEATDARIHNIAREYVHEPLAALANPVALASTYLSALSRIRKRLGGENWRQIDQLMRTAFAGGAHEDWIKALLHHYYDPMYDYQLGKKQQRVTFTGNATEVLAYLKAANANG